MTSLERFAINVQFLIHVDDKLLNFPETNVPADVRRPVVLKKDQCIFLLKVLDEESWERSLSISAVGKYCFRETLPFF